MPWSEAPTPREQEVLRHLLQGLTNKQIGLKMGIKVSTVKKHVISLLTKSGCQNRLALSLWAERNGVSGRSP